ncbi:MAG TPA: hypothetical protein VKB38_05175 [Terracidiphilus sp.]|nr:hypothetical protein [Terracidiphilus sp.]
MLPQSDQIGVSFLFTELESADTFLDIADTTSMPESADRNRRHAFKAYMTVRDLLPLVVLQEEEEADIYHKLNLIRQRLIEAGYSVELG